MATSKRARANRESDAAPSGQSYAIPAEPQAVDSDLDQTPERRKRNADRLREEGNLELALFSDDRSYGGLDQKNEAYVRRRDNVYDQPTVANIGGLIRGYQPTMPFQVGGSPFILPPGITVITGPTSVGKSSMLRELARVAKTDVALAVEPHDDPADIADTAYFDSADAALMYLVRRQRAHILADEPAPIAVLDSLRQAVFETTGAAGEKGMVMKFFTILTRVSTSLARNGISVLVTVNPLQTDPDALKAFIDRLKSSVPAVIELNSSRRDGASVSFSGSVSARPDRQARGFDFSSGGPTVAPSEEGSFEFKLTQEDEPALWAHRNSLPTSTI